MTLHLATPSHAPSLTAGVLSAPVRRIVAMVVALVAVTASVAPGIAQAPSDAAIAAARSGALSARLDRILDSPAARRALGIAAPAAPPSLEAPAAPDNAIAQPDTTPAGTPAPDRADDAVGAGTSTMVVGREAGRPGDAAVACLPEGQDDADRRVVIGTTEADARMLDALASIGRDAAGPGTAGVAARERIAASEARQRLAERVIRRRASPDVAVVFDDILVDCAAVEDVARLLEAWDLDAPHDARPTIGAAPLTAPPAAWRDVSARLLAAPMAMRHLLSARLAERLVLAGRLEPLLLLEPMLPAADRDSRARLVAAHLDLVHGRRDAGRAALAGLVGEDARAGQIAAVLLAERLDPMADMPLAMGWIGHLDLVGAIAFEHAGTRFGRRAARAEIGLTARALGRAAALRALSLSHARGLLETEDMRRMAAALWAVEDAPSDPVPLPLWAAAEPESFAALAETGQGGRDALPATPDPVTAPGTGGARVGGGTAPSTAPPDWRGRVSVAGSTRPAPSRLAREADAVSPSGPGPAALGRAAATPTGAAGTALSRRPVRATQMPDPGARGDLLAETGRLLERISNDMNAAEALLEDG